MRSGSPWLNNTSHTQTHKPQPSKNTTTTYSIHQSIHMPYQTLPSLTKVPTHHTTQRPPTLTSIQLRHMQPNTCHNLPLIPNTTPLHSHHHSSIHNNLLLTHNTTLHNLNHPSFPRNITHHYHRHKNTRARGNMPHQGQISKGCSPKH